MICLKLYNQTFFWILASIAKEFFQHHSSQENQQIYNLIAENLSGCYIYHNNALCCILVICNGCDKTFHAVSDMVKHMVQLAQRLQ